MLLHAHKFWKWLAGIATVIVIVVGWVAAQRIANVAAVQDAVLRDLEISFREPGATSDKPKMLPSWIDTPATDWIARHYDEVHADKGRPGSPWFVSRGMAYQERFRAVFRGPIHTIDITDPIRFRGDLGAAMARFPMLRHVNLQEVGDLDGVTEEEWKLLFTHLRSFAHLEEIDIDGAWITDAVIAPLAGHPQLRCIVISDGCLTEKSAKTFSALPRLKVLNIKGQRHEGDTWLTQEQKDAFAALLPAATVKLSD